MTLLKELNILQAGLCVFADPRRPGVKSPSFNNFNTWAGCVCLVGHCRWISSASEAQKEENCKKAWRLWN